MTDDGFERDGYLILRGAVPRADVELARTELERLTAFDHDARVMDAWRVSGAVRRVACHPTILDELRHLYGRRPIPFQTLDFRTGSEQRAHADDVHFDSRPAGSMCGVWVALEDVGADQGPLVYHPGSHRSVRVDLAAVTTTGGGFDYEAYEDLVAQQLDRRGVPAATFEAAAGDALVWAAGTAHGGAPIQDGTSTRWSQVTHYFFEGAVYVTPMRADPASGAEWVREPLVDICTGRRVRHLDPGGRPARLVRTGGGRAHVLAADDPSPPLAAVARSALIGVWRRTGRTVAAWSAARKLRRRRRG